MDTPLFMIGDRVRIRYPKYFEHIPVGLKGTIRYMSSTSVAVDFDKSFPRSHFCSDCVPSGNGYWITFDNLIHVKDVVEEEIPKERRIKLRR
jgi:hypothetical protein